MSQSLFLFDILNEQKKHYQNNSAPSLSHRIEKLNLLKNAVLKHQQSLLKALSADYGYRSENESLISEIVPLINQINYTLKKLKKWIKPQRREAGLMLLPAKVEVHYQPLGVVGIIVPWNFPVLLALSPLVSIMAAGNNAMIKMSEFTPQTNKVIKKLLNSVFSDNHVAVIEGDADIGAKFSELAFDHLLFTGSTEIGCKIMAAAANNLTPVTLELGGKSPVLIAQDMPIDVAVERMIYGKCLNAGQICVAPDYVLCHESQVEAFIDSYQQQFKKMYADVVNNGDYSNIINERQFNRIQALIDDAVEKGAKIHSALEDDIAKNHRKLATQLMTNVTDDMKVMQQEIFGPLLPIVSYQTLSEAIDYINQRSRPLSLYLMSFDKRVHNQIIEHTHSGGVCINESVKHVIVDDAPFGGIGLSGMGAYHGKEGFLRFSHAKTVLTRGKLNTSKLMHPPYGKWWQALFFKIFIR